MTSPAEAWHAVAGDRCAWCRRELLFLEGPICDPCLDWNELRPVTDKYVGPRERDRLEAEGKRDELVYPTEPLPKSVGRDRFAIDLATKEFVLSRDRAA